MTGSSRKETLSLSCPVPTNRMHDSATDLYLGQRSEALEHLLEWRVALLIAQPNGLAPGPDTKFARPSVARVSKCDDEMDSLVSLLERLNSGLVRLEPCSDGPTAGYFGFPAHTDYRAFGRLRVIVLTKQGCDEAAVNVHLVAAPLAGPSRRVDTNFACGLKRMQVQREHAPEHRKSAPLNAN